jgi:hypothetical protein
MENIDLAVMIDLDKAGRCRIDLSQGKLYLNRAFLV